MDFQEIVIKSMVLLDEHTPDLKVRRAVPNEAGKFEGESQMLFVEFDIEDHEINSKTDDELLGDHFHPALLDLCHNFDTLESIEVMPVSNRTPSPLSLNFPAWRLPFRCFAKYHMGRQRLVIRFELHLRKIN